MPEAVRLADPPDDPARERRRRLAAERMQRSRSRAKCHRACALVEYGEDFFEAAEAAGLLGAADCDDPAALRRALGAAIEQWSRQTLDENFVLRVTREQLAGRYQDGKQRGAP